MLVGCLVVKVVNTPFATWSTLMLLLSVHLATNYRAVRAVCMRTLNRQRANIVLSHLHRHNLVLTPKQVSAKERIFEHDGILRDADNDCLSYCRIGIPASELLGHLGYTDRVTESTRIPANRLLKLLDVFRDEEYVLFVDDSTKMAYILLKRTSDTSVQLKAWYHALLVAQLKKQDSKADGEHGGSAGDIQSTLVALRKDWESVKARLKDAGWDLNTAALETRSGSRVRIEM